MSDLARLLSNETASGSRTSASGSRPTSTRPVGAASNVLVQASPVKKRTGSLNPQDFTRPVGGRHALQNGKVVETRPVKKQVANYYIPPSSKPSTITSKLHQHRSKSAQTSRIEASRSTSFDKSASVPTGSNKGKARETAEQEEDRLRDELAVKQERQSASGQGKVERDEDSLRIIEKLEMGPKEFGMGPEGDGRWASIEPNSEIRLSKRVLPHHMLQEHLSDRFYIPPSLLYSVINPSRDGTSFTVPVDGDWVTIAVVAEQVGPIRTTKGGPAMGKEADSSGDEAGPSHTNASSGPSAGTAGYKRAFQPSKPKKFITFRLVALPPRSSGKSATHGDATVNMLLFEADTSAKSKEGKGKVYRGGSGGAFEKFWNVKVGTVLAILNPRVLRPLKNARSPHPLTNALALNPISADTVIEIGHARDMGRCTALKADGNRCSSWVDTRNGETCDYHVHALHKKLRSGRAEFASSTSAFVVGVKPSGSRTNGSSSTGRYIGGKDEYNPKEKWGLLPRDTREARQPTYVDGRHVVRDPSSAAGFEFVGEKLGRNQHEKLKRKRDEKAADEKILALLDKDGGSTQGGKLLGMARKQQRAREREKLQATGKSSKEGKGPLPPSDDEDEEEGRKRKKSAFKPEHIKAIGFDPTMLATGALRPDETPEEKQQRLKAISLLVKNDAANDDTLDLRPIAGRRAKQGWSSVKVPEGQGAVAGEKHAPPKQAEKFVDLDSDDD